MKFKLVLIAFILTKLSIINALEFEVTVTKFESFEENWNYLHDKLDKKIETKRYKVNAENKDLTVGDLKLLLASDPTLNKFGLSYFSNPNFMNDDKLKLKDYLTANKTINLFVTKMK